MSSKEPEEAQYDAPVLDHPLLPENIGQEAFESICKRYYNVLPQELEQREEARLSKFPYLLKQRDLEGTGAYLTKDELLELILWANTTSGSPWIHESSSLATFNTDDEVRKKTSEAFLPCNPPFTQASMLYCFGRLQNLKGVGPTIATLILSAYDPINIPFFSRELFRYLHWTDAPVVDYARHRTSQGWKRSLHYVEKEWMSLLFRIGDFKLRIPGTRAVDIEKVAFVLSQEQVDLGPAGLRVGLYRDMIELHSLKKVKRKVRRAAQAKKAEEKRIGGKRSILEGTPASIKQQMYRPDNLPQAPPKKRRQRSQVAAGMGSVSDMDDSL